MFDKLVELLINFVDLFRFWVIPVREGTLTVVYLLGNATRVIRPGEPGFFRTGLHLKWPLWIELEDNTSTRHELVTLWAQDLQTADGKKVRVTGFFRLSILPEKVVIWQTTLGDEDRAVSAALRSAIAETIIRRPLDDLLSVEEQKGLRQEILDRARKELNEYGYRIYDFKWIERTEAKTYRLITGD